MFWGGPRPGPGDSRGVNFGAGPGPGPGRFWGEGWGAAGSGGVFLMYKATALGYSGSRFDTISMQHFLPLSQCSKSCRTPKNNKKIILPARRVWVPKCCLPTCIARRDVKRGASGFTKECPRNETAAGYAVRENPPRQHRGSNTILVVSLRRNDRL